MKDQGERVVIDPRDAIAADGIAVAEPRPMLTPLRAALLIVGAIVGGVALSLILGTAPAHAADGDGVPAPGGDSLGDATSLVATATTATTDAATSAAAATLSTLDATVSRTVATAVPPVQTFVHATGDTVAIVAPVTAQVVQPVVTAVSGTLAAAVQLLAPVHEVLWSTAAAGAPNGLVPGATQAVAIAASAAPETAGTQLDPAPRGGIDGTLPSPLLTSSTGGTAAALGALFFVVALALLAARRRLDDDTLPPSPVFETDTSPA